MSLKLNERYPGRFNNPSVDYPGGSFKNRTTPDAKDGSYLEKDWANDKEGFFQSLLSAAGITASGAVDKVGASQFFDALQQLKQNQSGVAFTTTGPSAALVLAPTPAITAYAAGQRFRVKFSQNSTGTDTINVSTLGAKSIKQYDYTGAKVAAVYAVGQLADIEYDGVDFVILDPLPVVAGVKATETVPGIMKIATQTLVNGGTDDASALTAKKLLAWVVAGVAQATELVFGLAKVATQDLTNSGVDDTTIVTPKKMRGGFSATFGTTGYIALPTWMGGLIFNWGRGVLRTSNTFAIAFPNTYYVAFAFRAILTTAAADIGISTISNSAATFSEANGGNSVDAIHYFAIGK